MQNIHAHTWDQSIHFDPTTVVEADRARGRPMDLSVDYHRFIRDCAPFDKVAVFGLKARRTGYWVPDDYVASFCRRAAGTLFPFASCDPTQADYLEELYYAFDELSMVGLKMGPIYASFDPRDPRCDAVYTFCQERGIPILFHTGTTFNHAAPLGFSRPWLFDEVAIKYPELRMVLAHLAHPFSEECIVVIRKHPHVYADLSAIYYRPWQFYNTMILAQEYHVTDRILFGTDYPFTTSQESIDGVRNVNHVIGDSPLPRVSPEVIEAILARDAFALLGIES